MLSIRLGFLQQVRLNLIYIFFMHHILKYIQVCIPWGEGLKKFLKKVLIKFVLYRVIKQKVSTLYVCETVKRRWPFFASIVYTSKTYFYNLWSLHLGRKINKFRKRKKETVLCYWHLLLPKAKAALSIPSSNKKQQCLDLSYVVRSI